MLISNPLKKVLKNSYKKVITPPHLIGASLPCQDDDVRMATATILLGLARGSRRGGGPCEESRQPWLP